MKKLWLAIIVIISTICFVGCNGTESEPQEENKHNHDYHIEKVIAPTETEKGRTVHVCDCGDSYEDAFVDELGFSLNFLCSDSAAGSITGKTEQRVLNGKTSEKVVAVPNLGYKFVRWSNGELSTELTVTADKNQTYFAIFQIEALELPIIQINTQNAAPIVSKEDYVKCNVSVFNTDYQYQLDNESAKIRGRGNTSWGKPKNPYKLKFNSKIDLFGNGKAKTWTLIANYADPSLVRNYLAYSVGSVFDELEGYTTTTQNVELYLNGEYLGVYLVCEQTETGKTRVNIPEDLVDKKGNVVAPSDVGYLLELDGRAVDEGVEGVDYFLVDSTPYAIKTPDTEDEAFSSDYVDYISGYLSDCYNAVQGNDITAVQNLIDLDSFAATYIVHELFNCVDCGSLSFYLYKKPDGKLYSGPLWDFDLSVGNCDYYTYDDSFENVTNPEFLWAEYVNAWYSNLLKFDEFKDIVKNQLASYKDTIIATINACVDNVNACENAFNRNFEKWQTLGTYVWPNTPEMVAITTWEGQVDYVKDWLTDSLNYLISVYAD